MMNEIQKTISQDLRASAGTANWPTDFTLRCFIGMIETGEAKWDDFKLVGGEWLIKQMKDMEMQIDVDGDK